MAISHRSLTHYNSVVQGPEHGACTSFFMHPSEHQPSIWECVETALNTFTRCVHLCVQNFDVAGFTFAAAKEQHRHPRQVGQK